MYSALTLNPKKEENFTCKNTNCVKPSFIKVCYCRFYTVFFVNFVSACMHHTFLSNARTNSICVVSRIHFVGAIAVDMAVCRELYPRCAVYFSILCALGKTLLN